MKRTITKLLSLSLVLFMLMTTAPVMNTATAGGGVEYNLTVTPGCGFNMLKWDAIPGAAHYWIYRGPGPGQEFSTPLTDFPIKETEFKDTINIQNGQLYCYFVKAVDADAVEFDRTTEACATPNCYEEDECVLVLKYQQDNVKYWVNDVEQEPMETPPVNVNNRLFLVVRYVTTKIAGTQLDWEGDTKTVTITTRDGKVIKLQIGNKDAVIDGQTVQIDPNNPGVVPFIPEGTGRTLMPMRFVAENLGATGPNDIKWFGDTKIVELRFDDPECCDECNWVQGEIVETTLQSRINTMSTSASERSHLRIKFKSDDGKQHLLYAHKDLKNESKDEHSRGLLSKHIGRGELCIKNGMVAKWRITPDSLKPVTTGWFGAGTSRYYGNATNQPADINVSWNPNSEQASCVLDSSGYPHIVWRDITPGVFDIFYVHWNGSNWVCTDGTVYNPATGNANVSRNPSFASSSPNIILDGNDKPHIVWTDMVEKSNVPYFFISTFYVRWNGNDWVCADNTTFDPATGNAKISMDGAKSCCNSFALDSNGNPHIVYCVYSYSNGHRSISYTNWNGNEWVHEYVSGSKNSLTITSLVLDSMDNPHVTWTDYSLENYEISYIHRDNGEWLCADGTAYTSGSAYTGDPPSSCANVSNSAGTSKFSVVTVDSNDNPHIAWVERTPDDPSNGEISYVNWDGGNWVCANGTIYDPATSNANISNNTGTSLTPSLILDSTNNPHVAWTDHSSGNFEIFYTRWDGSNWLCVNGTVFDPTTSNANISNNLGVSYTPSLILDNNDNPHVAWQDNPMEQYR